MKVAEIINMRHGWEQPQEIRNMRKAELAEDCEHILKDMQQFNIDRYFNLLRMKGYEVKPRYDRQRKLVGYTVGKNASVFKASEIGRKFMASKIEDTWKKLHPQPTQVKTKPVFSIRCFNASSSSSYRSNSNCITTKGTSSTFKNSIPNQHWRWSQEGVDSELCQRCLY